MLASAMQPSRGSVRRARRPILKKLAIGGAPSARRTNSAGGGVSPPCGLGLLRCVSFRRAKLRSVPAPGQFLGPTAFSRVGCGALRRPPSGGGGQPLCRCVRGGRLCSSAADGPHF
eukprot:6389607-Lingulodinium_polyedra.AAC.1